MEFLMKNYITHDSAEKSPLIRELKQVKVPMHSHEALQVI